MKTTRLLLCFVLASLCFLFCSCGLFGDQQYACEAEDVKSIQIVCLGEAIEEKEYSYSFNYTVLCDVENKDEFIERLCSIRQTINWGDPCLLCPGYIVIRIEKHTGEYDLIYSDAQRFHREERNNYGYFYFDKEQFNALIESYLAQGDGSIVP